MKPGTVLFEIDHGRHSIRKLVASVARAFRKRKLRKIARAHIKSGSKQVAIFAFDDMGIDINEDGFFDREELEALIMWLDRRKDEMAASSAIDAGANIGNHSLYFSQFFRRVHAFEPNPRTFKVLSINAELADNITCYDCALSDKSSEGFLEIDATHTGGAHIGSSGSSIALQTLDNILDPSERIFLYKIDVEGHEYEALTGSEQTIRRNKPLILFEQLPIEIENGTSRTIELLKSYGYSNFAVMGRYPYIYDQWPDLVRGGIEVLTKLFVGAQTKLVTVSSFRRTYYSMIVALPD